MCLVNFFETYGHMISTIALLITLGVLIWYASEARKLRKETVKQTELSLRPYVILIHTGSGLLSFENIGQSHALDVVIDTLEMNFFRVRFQPCYLVKHGKTVKLGAWEEGKDTDMDEWIKRVGEIGFPFFEHQPTIKDYPLTLHYKNIEGTSYYTQLEVRVKERKVVVLKSDKDIKPHS